MVKHLPKSTGLGGDFAAYYIQLSDVFSRVGHFARCPTLKYDSRGIILTYSPLPPLKKLILARYFV